MSLSNSKPLILSRRKGTGGLLAIGASIFDARPVPLMPEVPGYRVISLIGRGGEAQVWRAERESDHLPVALKLPVDLERAAERLMAEGEVLGELDHPGIVRMIEFTEGVDGGPVLVLELMEGPDLAHAIPQGGFSFEEAVSLLMPVLEAMEHAHSRGIVHRDIKPANVLLGAGGEPKIADFGLAKMLVPGTNPFPLTGNGGVMGTPEYLAPERYEPDTRLGVAADVYALGIMLYEMLTGQPPRGSWRPLSEIRHLDVRLDQLMADATSPEPERRLASAGVFRARLDEILRTRPRYAGTPLVTPQVRMADAAWTLASLYTALAGFFSMRRAGGGSVPAMFDLTGGQGALLGGYVSAWTLLLMMTGVWLWQAWRLRIFRYVPVRDSLPSPFGLRWGEGRGAAAMVALTQFFCAGAGLFYLAELFFQSNHWLTADTPVWEKALCVTARTDLVPVNPWKWEPSLFFRPGFYVIRELQPGVDAGSFQLHGSQDFLIFVQPLLMAAGAVVIGCGMLLTFTKLVTEWGRRRRKSLLLVILMLMAAVGQVLSGINILGRDRSTRRAGGRPEQAGTAAPEMGRYDNSAEWIRLVRSSFGGQGSGSDIAPLAGNMFGPQIHHEHKGLMMRHELVSWLSAEHDSSRGQKRSLEYESWGMDKAGTPSSVWYRFEEYAEPEPGKVRGRRLTFRWWGKVTSVPPYLVFDQWDTEASLLYQGAALPVEPSAVEAWMREFLAELSLPGSPGMENFALPSLLVRNAKDPRQSDLTPRNIVADAFRRSCERWSSLQFYLLATPEIIPLPGGRCGVNASINWMGVRADGESEQPPKPESWRLEIAPYKGGWRLLRLDM